MKGSTIFTFIGIGLVVYLLARNIFTKFAEGISFVSAKAKFGSVNLNGININVTLNFKNINSIAVPIDSFVGTIYYGTAKLSNIKTSGPVLLAPNGAVTPVYINSQIDLLTVASDVRQLIINKTYLNDLNIEGIVTVKGQTFPVNYQISII